MPRQQPGRPPVVRPDRRVRSLSLRLDRILWTSISVPIEATFHYTEADPLAVWVEMRTPAGRTVTWAVSRDLLFDGTEEPSGMGDVRLWPSLVGTRRVLHMRLEARGRSCLFEMDLAPLQEWLLETFELVHPGTELAQVEWDAVVAALVAEENPPAAEETTCNP